MSCIRESRVDDRFTRPAPAETQWTHQRKQNDLVPELPLSGGYEKIVATMDVFCRYLFSYPISSQDAKTIAKVIIYIMTKHAYLPTTIISDKGSVFMSQVTKELAATKHAATKHAQTIWTLERTHRSLRKTLKIQTGERRSKWHKYINIAVFNYNTSYHTSIGCEPSRVFFESIPYNFLDFPLQILPAPDSRIAQDFLKQTEMIFHDGRKNTMQAYIKYKAYWYKKANASKLKEQQYVHVLQPKTDHQGSKNPLTDFRWIGPSLLERSYQITISWYKNSERTKPKSFIAWDYNSSWPDNPYPTYKQHHKNDKLTLKSP